MSVDLKAIGIGWGKWLGLIGISQEAKEESERRLKICESNVCGFAKKSKFLEFLSDGAQNVDSIYCSQCFCPCHQKSLTDKICELGYWDIKNEIKN